MTGRKIPYPWGRMRPEKRLEEINRMIERMRMQKDVLQHQFEQSVKKIAMTIESLEAQAEAAKSFAKEDEWEVLRDRVYALQMSGVPAMNAIVGKTIDQAREVIDQLEREQAIEPGAQKASAFGDDFLSSSLDEVDNLFEEKD